MPSHANTVRTIAALFWWNFSLCKPLSEKGRHKLRKRVRILHGLKIYLGYYVKTSKWMKYSNETFWSQFFNDCLRTNKHADFLTWESTNGFSNETHLFFPLHSGISRMNLIFHLLWYGRRVIIMPQGSRSFSWTIFNSWEQQGKQTGTY